MDSAYRLKIKIGQHEFEAEGPADVVNAQFQAFKDMIATAPPPVAPHPQIEWPEGELPAMIPPSRSDLASPDSALSKIVKLDGRVISLTARPKTADDAVMLVLYAQKVLRENDSVTGAEMLDGLIATGGLQVSRVDRMLEKLGKDGDVIVIGERRAKRYRLTNAGASRARQIAAELIATVA